MATKPGRMMTSFDGLLPVMSHHPLNTCPYEIRGSLTGGGSARKRLSRHRLLVIRFVIQEIQQRSKVLVSIEILINPFQPHVVFHIHRNQSFGLKCISNEWFLYEMQHRAEIS